MDNQRLFDLVRQCRSQLHTDNLISDDEYYELALEHGAVARLETYDRIIAQFKRYKVALEGLTPSGSEFVNEPERCSAHVRERLDSQHNIAKQAILRAQHAEACVAHLVNALDSASVKFAAMKASSTELLKAVENQKGDKDGQDSINDQV